MADHDDAFHPGTGEYIQIGVILGVLTAIEVALYFFEVNRLLEVPALLALTAMKFVLVVLWFMHLRFDNRVLRRLFTMGVVLAFVCFGVVGATFYYGPA